MRVLSAFCFSFASCSGVLSASTAYSTLSEQCWHEHPFATVNLRSSLDAGFELVDKLPLSATWSLGESDSKLGLNTKYGPWSHPPACTEVLQSIGDRLCVYTNAYFSRGRGISIFTTPTIAKEFATLPPFQDPNALKDINADSGSWYAEQITGKGFGLLAKKSLGFKDTVTAYTPALVAYLEGELPTMEREKFFRVAVSQLPQSTRDMFLQLATVYGVPEVIHQDVVKANTFQLEIGGQNHMAVFPETARINHDCAPNSQYYIDPVLLTHTVRVIRPVVRGEEITISYTSPLEFTDVRQQHLSNGFHFKCTCKRCAAKEATDQTLREIQDLQKSLVDWSDASAGSPKVAEKLLQLYRKEGLEGFTDIPYGSAALAYNAAGDTKQATKFAKLAQEIILMKDGPWTPNMQTWNQLLEDPQKHWSFKRRQQ